MNHMTYNIDSSIPGWMSERDLGILAKISSLCPEYSSMLEVGAFLGRSTYPIYANKSKASTLTVVDTFEPTAEYNPDSVRLAMNMHGDPDKIEQALSASRASMSWQAGFELCLGEKICSKLDIHACSSQDYVKTTDFDLVFIDGGHDQETVQHDIDKFISPTNLLIGDDFGMKYRRFKGLINAVSISKLKHNRTLLCPADSRLWILVPNSGYWHHTLGNLL